jgi:hypothetical protein
MGLEHTGRPLDKHIDPQELDALTPSSVHGRLEEHGLSFNALRDAQQHVDSCDTCARKLRTYRKFLLRISNAVLSGATSKGPDCPNDENTDWPEVAAGLWGEPKAQRLIMHAALCDYCGPRLRAATSVDDPTAREEAFLAQLNVTARPSAQLQDQAAPASPLIRRRLTEWMIAVPAMAMMMLIAGVVTGVMRILPLSPVTSTVSGPMFAEFAVLTHRRFAGTDALDVRAESQEQLNEWFKAKVPFTLALPASPPFPGEERHYLLKGAQLVPLEGKTAVYIAYHTQTGPVGLMVVPDSLAVASGGVEAQFKKVTFHYRILEGYKVVTWSLRGNTYALLSQEGNSTQQSCMVCHSPMRDRDLTKTPTPLPPDDLSTVGQEATTNLAPIITAPGSRSSTNLSNS